MASNNKEIVKVLSVETKGSDVRVKSLRQEIAALNEVLKNTEQGSAEYNAAVQQIKNNQDLLSKSMKSTKTEAEALDGSYDALTNKLNELKKAWKATNDEVQRSKLADEIKEVKGALTEMDNSLGNFKTNSEDALSTFKDEMSDAQDKIEPFKAKFESIQKISAGVASGFAAVQGAMALMGVENDKLGQTFIKLQAAMAIAQGIGGLGDLVEGMSQAKVAFSGAITSVKAFITSLRGMKLAMAATGIGAALVLVGLLAKAYLDLADATDKAKEAKERLDKIESEGEFDNKKKRVALTQEETKAYNEYVEDLKNANGNKTKIEEAELKLKKKLREESDKYYQNEIDNLTTLKKELEKTVKVEEDRLNANKRTRENFDKTQGTNSFSSITNPINEGLRKTFGNLFGNKLYSKEEIQEQENSLNELKNKLVQTNQEIADAERAIQDNKVEAAQETSDKLVGISDSTNAQLKENAEKAKEFAKATLASYSSNVDLSLTNIKTNVEYNLKAIDKLTNLSEKDKAKEKNTVEDKYKAPGFEVDGKEVEGELEVVETVLRMSYQNQIALLYKKQQDEIALITNNKEAVKEIEEQYGVDILKVLEEQHQAEKDALSQQYNEKLANYKEYLKNRQEAYINTRMGILGDKLYDLEVDKDKKMYKNEDTYGYAQSENKESKSNKWRWLDKENYWDELDTKPEEIEKERITKENAILDEEHNKKIGYINEELSLMEARFGAEAKNTEAYKELVRQKTEADDEYNNNKAENDRKIIALDAANDKKKIERKRTTANIIMDIASSMFGSLSSILGEESKAGKAFAVAQATIDTYKAANSAYASMAGIPVVGPGLGAAAAAAAVLAGIANVKKILEVPDDGKETSSPSSSSVASQSIVRPNISLSDTIPTQLTQNLMTDSELSELNKSTRVYVTETDISDTMNKVEVTENNASF